MRTITSFAALVLPQERRAGCAAVLITALLAAVPARAGEPLEAVVALSREPADEESWMKARIQTLVRGHLERLGVDTSIARAPKVYTLELRRDQGTWTAAAAEKKQPKRVLKARGRGDSLDAIAGAISLEIAGDLGAPLCPEAEQLLLADRMPVELHKLLASAKEDLDQNQNVRARMSYERASALWKSTILPEALIGTWWVQSRTLAKRDASADAKSELAASALERAQFHEGRAATARGDDKLRALEEVRRAYQTFLRFTPNRARRWIVAAPSPDVALLSTDREWWLSDRKPGPREVETIHALAGARTPRPGLAPVVALAGGDPVRLEGRVLERLHDGVKKWRLELPFAPRLEPDGKLPVASGFALVRGEDTLAWVDLGVGQLRPPLSKVRPLAVSPDGALVLLDEKTLGLVRAGRKAAAWRTPVEQQPRSVAAVRGRVLLLFEDALHLIDAQNGKLRGEPLAVPRDARWLGAEGRFAVIGTGGHHLEVFDVLAGVRTAKLEGPSVPLVATAAGQGVAVAFESGDVLVYDRDGVLLDRARVNGRPRQMAPGPASAPGFVVLTDRKLASFGEPPSAEAPRDVEIMLRLAEVSAALGDRPGALRLAEHLARRDGGRAAEAEALRARLLAEAGHAGAAKRASARSEAAKDPKTPLPPFALCR